MIRKITNPALGSIFILIACSMFEQAIALQWTSQLERTVKDLNKTTAEYQSATQEYSLTTTALENIKTEKYRNKYRLVKAREAYELGAKNYNHVSMKELVALLEKIDSAEHDYKVAVIKEQELTDRAAELEQNIHRLENKKSIVEIQVLEIKGIIYDDEISKTFWSEGYGECLLDQSKTVDECKQTALSTARLDAIQKGRESLISSLVENKNLALKRDALTKTINVRVVDEDDSGQFGRALPVEEDDQVKYRANVRLKLQAEEETNPFKEQIEQLKQSDKR